MSHKQRDALTWPFEHDPGIPAAGQESAPECVPRSENVEFHLR
jgi:hypothetical protein